MFVEEEDAGGDAFARQGQVVFGGSGGHMRRLAGGAVDATPELAEGPARASAFFAEFGTWLGH
ncbi:hypothetical protein GCM10010276_89680 [Streptomyces longisporus]|uniref:Uncharacterized protein n=1 Tax=Streptomyces longisporus TaxID=1948 RepID=A0ABN3NLL8_STRLO